MATKASISRVDPLRLTWLLRDDLRRGAPAASPQSQWFHCWWVVHGRREYPAWATTPEIAALGLFVPSPDRPSYGRFGMTPLLAFLFDQGEDLHKVFDITTQGGLWHAIAWFFSYGVRAHGLLDVVDEATQAALDEAPPFLALPDDLATRQPRLTWLMFFVWRCASRLQATYDLRTPGGQADYLQWFLLEGVPSLGLAPLVAPHWRAWLRQPLALKDKPDVGVPRAALLLWQRRKELQQAFDLRQPDGWAGLAAWAQKAWQAEPRLHWAVDVPSPAPPAPPRVSDTSARRPFGLNLIGFAFGELGIGEDVRMAVQACEQAGIPFKVVNIHPGGQLRQADRALADHVADTGKGEEEAPYAINLFCLTGFDTARVFLEHGAQLFTGRYTIGWWPWELPVWPKDWQMAFDVVDEVWAATHFTRQMYEQAQQHAASPAVVSLMPLAASVSRVKTVDRRALGLPERRFLFLYVFDFNSSLVRKNPLAAAKAFRRAFPLGDDSVGLVLKTMNSSLNNPVWQAFVRECAADARIVLLVETLDRGEVLGLIQACDAYVSLHRSEGFGRTLAEAMLFGKPVVGTNFSGNVDFLTPATGFPVQWQRQPVKPGEYPFVTAADAAWWADPDLADAARKLRLARKAAQDKAFAPRLKRMAEEQFSPERIGQMMRERVETIYRQIDGA